MLGWKIAVFCLEEVFPLSEPSDDGLVSSSFLAPPALTAGSTRFGLFSLTTRTGKTVSVTVTCVELRGFVEEVVASNVSTHAGEEAVVDDVSITALDVVRGAAGGGMDVSTLSSAWELDSRIVSAFFPDLKALGLSLEILARRSVCVPLTALETVPNVFLTRDICWFRPDDQRDVEEFKYNVLVWSPSLNLTWFALQSQALRTLIHGRWM